MALHGKIGIAEVLSFPLTSAPLSLDHTDGTLLKTQKKEIDERIAVRNQTTWMLLSLILHMWKEVSATLSNIVRYLLIKLFNQKGNITHRVSDKVTSTSVKDCNHNLRSGCQDCGGQYKITILN